MLKYYIVDDEQNAVDALHAMLQKKFPQQVVSCGSNIKASKAIKEIEGCDPDILFLDVEMPEMNGLDLLKHFPERTFEVIFTTAHEKYALPAIKAAAADYLVKPLSPHDVFDALKKSLERRAAAINKNKGQEKITINAGTQIFIVDALDIIRIEASNNYSHFHFVNRPKLLISKTLKEFEEQLINHSFFRVHQSHLINLKHIASVKTSEDIIIMKSGDTIEISRRKRAAFLQKLKAG